MKAENREHVEGTEHPRIHIFRRMVKDAATGNYKPGRKWWCQYTHEGKQHSESLNTPMRSEALRKVHSIHRQLLSGERSPRPSKMTVSELVEKYIAMLESRGRAKTTLTKYRTVLRDFAGVCEKGLKWTRPKSTKNTSTPTANGSEASEGAKRPSTPTK
jgi:hypothetical protein